MKGEFSLSPIEKSEKWNTIPRAVSYILALMKETL